MRGDRDHCKRLCPLSDVTTRGVYRIVPVRQANGDGKQNEYHRTKIGLVGARRMGAVVHRQENRCYKVFPAPAGRSASRNGPT